ncbi:phosphoribosylformylglycinamidine cyclo-ligase [Mycobacterium ulcerans str. Harvey]|uniref:Phosphoribosylformylglycinamidine cyclo-ligase n=1 Tax=Mycobacterium ulcerans str. Harvey TaxID=1299332 RepID=A0ABP3ANM4_MYCUL|nr:phosphoribosylformylglycinamidine cyclo-ligase [Mycobacterium ulcerans str. Harvey]
MTDPEKSPESSGRGPASQGVTYAAAGVDIEAGDRAVELFKPLATRATRPEVRGGLGGFAGLFALRNDYREPVLAASTDGVGTKLAVAQAMDKHDTVGLDLVAMVVDDLVVCGAEPLFLQDYIAVGRTVPERVSAIVSGIAEGCVRAGCALLGGETAEHPGLMAPDHYDISATGVGVVEADNVLGRNASNPATSSSRWARRAAFQRLLAGPQRPAGDRPDESGRLCGGVRPHVG